MNVIKILPITDLATEMHNPMIEEHKEIMLDDRKLNITVPCNISVIVNNKCPYNCEWCINKDYPNEDIDDIGEFDRSFDHLLDDLQLINRKTKRQNFEITLTGGEPLLTPGLFITFVNNCFIHNIPIRTVSTTGINMFSSDTKLMNLFGAEIKSPVYKFMIEHGAIHNINISMHSTNPEHNAAIFGVDKEPLSVEDLGKLSTVFRLYGGEVRASANIHPHKIYGISSFGDILAYMHKLYKEGVKSFIFREIIGSDKSSECMDNIRSYINKNMERIESLYINGDTSISIHKMNLPTFDDEFLIKIYMKDIIYTPDNWPQSLVAYREYLGYQNSTLISEKLSPVYSNLVFSNGKLYTDFDCKDLLKKYTL